MRNTLRTLTTVRGVLAAGVFDERGTRLAVCGHAPALAALTFADANPSFSSGVEPETNDAVVERDDFADGRVLTYPLDVGVLEIVVDVRADHVDPALAMHVDAAAHALNVVLESIDGPSLLDGFGLGTIGSQGPNSETIPCFVRPPGF